MVYGIVDTNISIILWNVLFGASHTYAVVNEILLAQRLTLTDELERLHETLFPKRSRTDFFFLWAMGSEVRPNTAEILINLDDEHNQLLLVLEGDISVHRSDGQERIAYPSTFLGEMRLLRANQRTLQSLQTGRLGFIRGRTQNSRPWRHFDQRFIRQCWGCSVAT